MYDSTDFVQPGWCCSPQYPDGIRIFASVGFLSFQVSLSSYRAGRAPKGDVIFFGVFFIFYFFWCLSRAVSLSE